MRTIFIFIISWGIVCATSDGEVAEVQPALETDPVAHAGDKADDGIFWVHPADPCRCAIIATDKDDSDGGLIVYDDRGRQLHYYGIGKINNVDVRYDFPLGGARVDIVGANNRSANTIVLYRIDPNTRALIDIAARPLETSVTEVYGFCLYHSWQNGRYYAFVNDKAGVVEQWELQEAGQGNVGAHRVRRFEVGSQTEGMVADDALGFLYVGEEDVGIWKYGAEPNDPTGPADRYLVDSTDSAEGGHLSADVEGLALYQGRGGTGYLIGSSQGEDNSSDPLTNTYAVYQREGNNTYLMSFRITANAARGIDAVTNTDGVALINTGFGRDFPQGVFLAQDGSNPGGNQNFKLVPWDSIAGAVSPALRIDLGWDPRSECGRWGYPRSDLNHDCRTDLEDLMILMGDWLLNYDPAL